MNIQIGSIYKVIEPDLGLGFPPIKFKMKVLRRVIQENGTSFMGYNVIGDRRKKEKFFRGIDTKQFYSKGIVVKVEET